MVGPGRAECPAAVGPPSVVMPGIVSQDAAEVAFAEDQHPVGDLSPGGEHKPFRISIRARAPGRDLHGLDARAREDRVEGCGELPGRGPRTGSPRRARQGSSADRQPPHHLVGQAMGRAAEPATGRRNG